MVLVGPGPRFCNQSRVRDKTSISTLPINGNDLDSPRGIYRTDVTDYSHSNLGEFISSDINCFVSAAKEGSARCPVTSKGNSRKLSNDHMRKRTKGRARGSGISKSNLRKNSKRSDEERGKVGPGARVQEI